MSRLVFVHTVASLEPLFEALAVGLAPSIDRSHVVDEGLLAEAIAAGTVPAPTAARLQGHLARAVASGADLVVVTCSSMGTATEAIAARHGWPVMRIDEAMADAAVATGSRIGVLATLRSTLVPTADLVGRRAGDAAVEIVPHLVDGAFAALKAGDTDRHDHLVGAALRELAERVDVVVLAQASMARVATGLGGVVGTPILSSPRLGVERAVARLASAASG